MLIDFPDFKYQLVPCRCDGLTALDPFITLPQCTKRRLTPISVDQEQLSRTTEHTGT